MQINSINSAFCKFGDVLVLLAVGHVATTSIVLHRYGANDAALGYVYWYGLAALYGGCSWLLQQKLKNRGLLICTWVIQVSVSLVAFNGSFLPVVEDGLPLWPIDWIALGVGCLSSACGRLKSVT